MKTKEQTKNIHKKKAEKKQTTTKKKTKSKKESKGFTLIELLAVVIILGILMIIAIPSVTTYISNSRKNSYVDTAKEITGGARNLVNSGKLSMYDVDTTYYIPVKCISTENRSSSPYGDFTKAYVAVIYNGDEFNYYWISNDTTGQGIKSLTSYNDLNVDNITEGIKDNDILDIVETTGIGGREKIRILNQDCGTWGEEKRALNPFGDDNDGADFILQSGDGSNIGDIYCIDTYPDQCFYVISHNENETVLLGVYNLYVGEMYKRSPYYYKPLYKTIDPSDPKYFLQDPSSLGNKSDTMNITVPFSGSHYWENKVGSEYPGNICLATCYNNPCSTECASVYDSNYNGAPTYIDENTQLVYPENYSVAYYLEKYKEKINLRRDIEIRIPTAAETYFLTRANGGAYKYINDQTTYWISAVYESGCGVWKNNSVGEQCTSRVEQGIRPVIVVDNDLLEE